MKTLLAFLIISLILLFLAGCTGGGGGYAPQATATTTEATTAPRPGYTMSPGMQQNYGMMQPSEGQMHGQMAGGGMRGGMMGGGMGGGGMTDGICPMCGRPFSKTPERLPTPQSSQWLANFWELLALERLSLVQYRTDEDKFQISMPYMMIIPQEENHIQWIKELFDAYGLSAAGPTPAIKRSQSVTQAYEIARGLEADLIPRYEWLISNAEDDDTRQVINLILFQTRMHYMMSAMPWEWGA